MTSEYAFVGIDPGTTAALACIGLDGQLVGTRSRKEFGKSEMLAVLADIARPLVVATDVAPAPDRVAAIAANTGSALHVPDQDLAADRKDELVAGFDPASGDAHTLDALAAAEHARRAHRDTLDRIRRRTRDLPGSRRDAVLRRVIQDGEAVGRAVDAVTDTDDGDGGGGSPARERDWERLAERRLQRLQRLERRVQHMEDYIEGQEAADEGGGGVPETELRRRNRRIRELRDERDRARARAERLEDETGQLRAAIERLRDGWRYAPHVDAAADADAPVVVTDTLETAPADAVETVLVEDGGAETGTVRVVPLDDVERCVVLEDAVVVAPDALSVEDDAEADAERFMTWLEGYRDR